MQQCGETLVYNHVSQLALLGDIFDHTGSTELSRAHRQGIADAIFYKHKQLFQHPGPMCPRLKAWHDSPATSGIFGASSWHLTREVLSTLRAWELGKLRQVFRMRRRSLEPFDKFNQRTAHKLYDWFKYTGIMMAFHRVLKVVYKSAWQENVSPCNFDAAPLKWAREYRDEAWRTALLALPKRARLKDGPKQQRRGPPTVAWENPFVAAYGLHWRSRLDACSSLAAWMKECEAFINLVCDKWRLPSLSSSEQPSIPIPRLVSVNIPALREHPPTLPTSPLDESWGSRLGRLWVQVDCKALAELLAGRAILTSDGHRPLMIRLAGILRDLHRRWMPMQDTSDYIVWSPREYNSVADHAVNASMDSLASWSITEDASIDQALANNTNLRLCVDGGRRNQQLAGIGMALYAAICEQDGSYRYQLLGRHGMILKGVDSAFLAEALGLEWALGVLLERCGGSNMINIDKD